VDTERIPCIEWKPDLHYHIHKSPSLVPIVSQTNPTQTTAIFILGFCRLHFILPSGVIGIFHWLNTSGRIYIFRRRL